MILYLPLLLIALIGLFFAARTGMAQVIAGQRSPAAKLAVGLAVVVAISAGLMFGVNKPWAPWAAVVVLGLIVVPAVTPVALILIGFGIAKLTGKPIRWN